MAGTIISATALSSGTATVDSKSGGVVGTATISFTSAIQVPIGGKIVVTFPNEYGVAADTVSSHSNLNVMITDATTVGKVVTVIVSNSFIALGATVSFKLNGITNPAASTTQTYSVKTTDSNDFTYQQSTGISGDIIVAGSLETTSVVPASTDAGVTGSVTVQFTTTVSVPSGGKIEVTFPTDYVVSGSTSVSSPSGFTSSATPESVVGRKVTIVLTALMTASAKSFQLSGITNPGT